MVKHGSFVEIWHVRGGRFVFDIGFKRTHAIYIGVLSSVLWYSLLSQIRMYFYFIAHYVLTPFLVRPTSCAMPWVIS